MFNCFRKPKPRKPVIGELLTRKTGLIIGHSTSDKGADNKKWYSTGQEYNPEYDEWTEEYDLDGDYLLEEYELNLDAAEVSGLFFADRNEGRGRRGAAEELGEADCTEGIAMHCNSYKGETEGFEFWYLDGVVESKRFAQRLLDAFKKEFPNHKSRGIKKSSRGSRPYGVLDAMRDNGIYSCALAEWYFLDNPNDFIEPERIGNFLRRFGAK